MSRLVAVAVGCGLVLASLHAQARTGTTATSSTTKKASSKKSSAKTSATKKSRAKKLATKTAATKKATRTAKKQTGKRKHASKRERALAKRKKRGRSTAALTVAVKTTDKPLVTVARFQSDGRPRYGADRMPPGFAWPPTNQMQATSKACEQALDGLGVKWEPAAPEGMIVDPVVVPAMEIAGIKYTSLYKRPPHKLDCQFVHSLALLGPELHALGVREVQFGSIYRNTLARSHGQTKTFRSRHSLGIAMDIMAFVDDTGRVAKVEMEYLKGDPLLHAVEDVVNKNLSCRQLLTPGNDPISHADHFHIEASVDFTAFR